MTEATTAAIFASMERAHICFIAVLMMMASACQTEPDPGLLGMGPLYPYPSTHLEVEQEDGISLDFSGVAIPISNNGNQTPLPVERLTRLDGFPTISTIVVPPWAAAPDPSTLPSWPDIGASVEATSPIAIIDLDSGARIPFFAELDANESDNSERSALLIRPQAAYPPGGRVAVVLTTDLTDALGQPIERPEYFAALLEGTGIEVGLKPFKRHYQDLFARLEDLGFSKDDLLLAWDFHVASSARSLAPFDRVLSDMKSAIPMDSSFQPTVTLDRFLDSDLGDVVPPNCWRLADYDIEIPSWVDEDGTPSFGSDGLPLLDSTQQLHLEVMVPQSVRGASAGTSPVLIFGHGLLADPSMYLADVDDPSRVIALANEMGAIVIATRWRGLTQVDLVDATRVALDIGVFPIITDRLIQGVVNTLMLERLTSTSIADLPVFEALDGGGSMLDPTTQYYYGISLGGIEGTVFAANAEHIQSAVLHVPGSAWSSMLERSSNWRSFDVLAVQGLPDPLDRQILYAMTQNFWDPVDPLTHAAAGRLTDVIGMWQESIGDEEVPNFTTELLVRTAGIPLIQPSVTAPWGLDVVNAPTGPGAQGLYQYDSGIGMPPFENRPAPVTGAHKAVRKHDEHLFQTVHFFESGGDIIDACSGPCIWAP